MSGPYPRLMCPRCGRLVATTSYRIDRYGYYTLRHHTDEASGLPCESRSRWGTPNPGSTEALDAGCTCAVLDNHYGRSMPARGWWITGGCPVHDPRTEGAS